MRRVLVAIDDVATDRDLVDLASALADGGEVVLAAAVEVPESRPLSSARDRTQTLRRRLEWFARSISERIRVTVKVARTAMDARRLPARCASSLEDRVASWPVPLSARMRMRLIPPQD